MGIKHSEPARYSLEPVRYFLLKNILLEQNCHLDFCKPQEVDP